ncbi:major facilitator superfamily domain-containing protein [Cytidiella melzeri]|nr:major facilitator superfamily domain-containing protein [Cytidiella melzeri]
MRLPAIYVNPMTQVVLVGITCFATVGMFSAVSNLGAGGTQDVSLSDTSNGVLYGFFAVIGLIAGGINNCELLSFFARHLALPSCAGERVAKQPVKHFNHGARAGDIFSKALGELRSSPNLLSSPSTRRIPDAVHVVNLRAIGEMIELLQDLETDTNRVPSVLGPKLTLFIGTLGYALYVGALWCFQTQGTRWFLIFAGAILGITAALLWSAQGSIMMSYPLEKDKGKAFGIFWAIFQFGSFIGAVIALAININSGGLSAVSTSTYIAFLVIIFVGIASAFLVLPPNRVIRSDGTLVKLQAHSSVKEELLGMLALLKDWRMLALLPMFFASNYFYAYQGSVNATVFDAPTRALNATLEGAGAIIGALMIGFGVLDANYMARRTRGYVGLGVVTVIIIIVWAVGLSWQVTFQRDYLLKHNNKPINYHDDNYAGKGALFFFYYFGDACYQALAYWIMSALTNDPFKLARYAGLYKAIQSAGGAGSFGMDAVLTPLLNEHLASWIMMLVSFPLAFLVIRTIKETNYEDEEMVFVDEEQKKEVLAGHEIDVHHEEVTDEKASAHESA